MMAHPSFGPGMGGPGHLPINGHPMGVPHPGSGHMGNQPGPGMMQGLHPGVPGPQSQGPMVTGMPPGAGTPAPMQQNGMAMAHLGPQHMFQQGGQPGQMNLGQMQAMSHQANNVLRQRLIMQQQQQQQQQQQGMPMNSMNNPLFQQQMAQMKMGIPMQQPHLQNMQQQQFQHHQQQQQQHQQQQHQQQQHRLMAQAHAAQQQQQQAAAMRQAHSQQAAAAAQQMQMSRSQEQTTQPPQPMPTPAPSNQTTQPPSQTSVQAQQQAAQQPPKPQPTPQPAQQQGTPAASVKADAESDEPQIKQQDAAAQLMMHDIPKQQPNDFTGQCILQLLLYQDKLANPEKATDLGYWEDTIQKYFSPAGSIRQQLYNNKQGNDKTYQLHYPLLARFFYTHFTSGIKQILMQSFDHNQQRLPSGGIRIFSDRASLTYVFGNDLRVTTQGSLRVTFDDMQKIEHMFIATTGWTEYVPRHLITASSPVQTTSPKMTTKNAKKPQKPQASGFSIPTSSVQDFGMPGAVLQFLEIAEVMTAMGPLMEFFNTHPGISPREALLRIGREGPQSMAQMQQNANMMAVNGQIAYPQQRMGMNVPNQLQSPALQHLGLPHPQGSPGMASNHTGSPAQSQGGIPMMHQMSAQGSNMNGPSNNTSPNVSNKRRRPSGVKMEDENSQQDAGGGDKVKPSPRMGGKRQKGQA